MKYRFLFSLLSLLVICSCQNTDKKERADETQKLVTMERFADSKIGTGDGTSFKLAVTEKSLLEKANEFVMSSNDGEQVSFKYKIETINSRRFLRLYREDGLISTVAIEYNSDKEAYFTGNTVCTSSSKENGCIPDDLYCTKIEGDAEDDCTKTSFAFYVSK